MKRGAISHPKLELLATILECGHAAAIGHYEALLHFTAQFAPAGDIGKWPDSIIAARCFWGGDAHKFICALEQCTLIDQCETHRFITHDWSEHCEDSIHISLARQGKLFADQTPPKLSRLGRKERTKLSKQYADIPCAQKAHKKRIEAHTVRTAMPCLVSYKETPLPPLGDFALFWECYPKSGDKKPGKQAAMKAWEKLKLDTWQAAVLTAAVMAQRQTEDWRKDGGRFIPHASTWLNGHRWEDELGLEPEPESDRSPGLFSWACNNPACSTQAHLAADKASVPPGRVCPELAVAHG